MQTREAGPMMQMFGVLKAAVIMTAVPHGQLLVVKLMVITAGKIAE